jgi:hypothetical protein
MTIRGSIKGAAQLLAFSRRIAATVGKIRKIGLSCRSRSRRSYVDIPVRDHGLFPICNFDPCFRYLSAKDALRLLIAGLCMAASRPLNFPVLFDASCTSPSHWRMSASPHIAVVGLNFLQ